MITARAAKRGDYNEVLQHMLQMLQVRRLSAKEMADTAASRAAARALTEYPALIGLTDPTFEGQSPIAGIFPFWLAGHLNLSLSAILGMGQGRIGYAYLE